MKPAFFCTVSVITMSLSILACKEKPVYEHRNPTVQITVNDDIDSGFAVSSYISEFEFVALQQTPKSIIGEINKIAVCDNKIYVVDRFVGNAVFVFDKKGQFLWRLGSLGHGEGQYSYPHDIIVDSVRHEVKVLDSENMRINVYSTKDGRFLYTKSLNFKSSRFTETSKFTFFIGSNESLIATVDNGNKNVARFFPRKAGLARPSYESFHAVNDSVLLFQINYVDTIYRIQDDLIFPYVSINYGKEGVPPGDIDKYGGRDPSKSYQEKRITYRYYFETNGYIFFTFIQNKRLYANLYSKSLKTIKTFPYDAVKNDITFEDHFPVIQATTRQGDFVAVVNGNMMTSRITNALQSTKIDSSLLKKIVKLKSEQDPEKTINPVLMFFKFK